MAQTVTVICRLPSGLVLTVYPNEQLSEMAKARVSAVNVVGKSVTLKGAGHDPRYHPADNILLGMGGRTEVDKDFWDAWKAQNENSDFIRKNLVFAAVKADSAVSKLDELKSEKTGLEGLEQNTLQKYSPDN